MTLVESARAEAVHDSTRVNGIDYLEVLPGQTKLELHFHHPLPGQTDGLPTGGATLDRRYVRVEGGDRVRGIRVLSTSTTGDVMTVTVNGPGDFSTYRLRLVDPATQSTPTGFDPLLSTIDFSFKAGCPIRFDCKPTDECPPEPAESTVRDYLAKDFESFRQLMLDRMSASMPDWREHNVADQQVMLVELLSFVADRLSYWQDAVATEAYLGTARRRVSVRRHARLLGYRMHEGCAARAFVRVDSTDSMTIEAGRRFLTGEAGDTEAVVFESLHPLAVLPDRGELDLYTWMDARTCLPRGATAATLCGRPPLQPGDFLLLQEVAGRDSGEPAEADRTRRHVVRLTKVTDAQDPLTDQELVEVEWAVQDALPFPFCISVIDDANQRRIVTTAHGNVVLVEQGARIPAEVKLSDQADVAGRWRPRLPHGRPTWAVPYDDDLGATQLLDLDPRKAVATVEVRDADGNDFDAVPDLLDSLPEDAHFVVEAEDDASATLRFGDGTYGREPNRAGDSFATYRLGHGAAGNVGAESISVMDPPEENVAVTNPLPAVGGADPEPTEQVRIDAPHAFRIQERAVTEADYGTILTERKGGVQRATGRMRWTGSWYTAFVTVDRAGGGEVDADYRREVSAFLDGYRMAGVDVDVSSPTPVPLEIALSVCAHADRYNSDVERDVLEVLSSRTGLFHPDRFTFGTPVYLSQVYAAVLGVPGVATVRATRFRRYAEPDRGELEAGVLRVHDLEIAQLANDPDVPERGLLTVTVAGGR